MSDDIKLELLTPAALARLMETPHNGVLIRGQEVTVVTVRTRHE